MNLLEEPYAITTDEILSFLNGKTKNKGEGDYFISRGLIPLGVRSWKKVGYDGYVPPENEVNIPMQKTAIDNPLNILFLDRSGRQKTRELKNLCFNLSKGGDKIVVIQAKSNDWEQSDKIGTGKRIHHKMVNSRMKVKAYVPSLLKSKIPVGKEKEYRLFSPKISNFDSVNDWRSLDFSDIASRTLASYVVSQNNKSKKEGKDSDITLKQLYDAIKGDREMLPASKSSALAALKDVERNELFSYKGIPYEKDWEDGSVVIITLFSPNRNEALNVIISKEVKEVQNIGEEENQQNKITKKRIIFEDAYYYIYQGTYVVLNAVNDILHNYRALGITCALSIQHPGLLNLTLVEGFEIKIIGKINSVTNLDDIPKSALRILRLSDNEPGELRNDRDNYLFERMIIYEDKVIRYYPYDSLVGHPTSPQTAQQT